MLAVIVDPAVLGELIAGALIAGVGTTAVFALTILGTTRSSEARQAGNHLAATGYMLVALVAFALFAAGVAFGILTITSS